MLPPEAFNMGTGNFVYEKTRKPVISDNDSIEDIGHLGREKKASKSRGASKQVDHKKRSSGTHTQKM